jgi:carbon-monoxide dehydrogenase medium subunit
VLPGKHQVQVPAPFAYERATSVEHALELLAGLGPDARLLAGGHSLLPMMKLRLASTEYLIDIDDLAEELGYIREHCRAATRAAEES